MSMSKKEFKKFQHDTSFDLYLKKELKNAKFKKMFDEEGKKLEIAYSLLQLRKNNKMSQLQLAKRIKTTQGNIARLEAGNANITIETLHKIATVFNKDLKVEFVELA